jgi:SAM-dependent methyltransferase
MGIDKASLQVLLDARRAGVSFHRILTVGRQELRMSPGEVRSVLSRNGLQADDATISGFFSQASGYCEPLLRFLGASQIDSLDVSDFEGASIVHDMNEPLPEMYHRKFTFVFDGGSLEHVFQFPTALKNCMDAVVAGGHFVTVTPANNLMGHGFYQFSPELFFRALGPRTGFEVVKILLYEYPWKRGPWYEVADPDKVGTRVGLTNRRQVYMVVWARKLESTALSAETPQQSDYARRWDASPSRSTPSSRDVLTGRARDWFRSVYLAAWPFGSRYYKRVRP